MTTLRELIDPGPDTQAYLRGFVQALRVARHLGWEGVLADVTAACEVTPDLISNAGLPDDELADILEMLGVDEAQMPDWVKERRRRRAW